MRQLGARGLAEISAEVLKLDRHAAHDDAGGVRRRAGRDAEALSASAQPASPPVLVRVDGVSKTFREGESATEVLRDVRLELARGATTSLVGRSGSGKTTLISVLAGLVLPDAGR